MHRQNSQDLANVPQISNSLLNQEFLAVAILIGKNHVIKQANELVCKIWGRDQKEVLNFPLFDALPEIRDQGAEELLAKVMTSGKPYIGKEMPVPLKRNGHIETVYFDFTYSPVRDEKTSEIIGITVLAVDVTDRVHATHDLVSSEKRYRTLVEQSPLSMQILSPNGKTLNVNKAWETLWGADMTHLKGYNMLKDQQLVKLGIMPFIKKGFAGEPTFIPPAKYEPQKTIETMEEVPYRWVQAFIYPIKDEEDRIQEVVLVHQDITELIETEEKADQLALERSQLISLNLAKDEFIALASHQLRTPATGVKQYLGIALDGYAGEISTKLRDVLLRANASNERQLNIIEDLLKVAQVDAGTLRIDRRKTELEPLVSDVLRNCEMIFKLREQTVHLTSTAKNIVSSVDVLRLRMVLENIIDNASKYTPAGKSIHVDLSQARDQIRISIKDEGVGIAKESLDKLFQKFSRIDNPLSLTVGGTGLGLYWAKKIMELHGGDIYVESAPGKGSTFTVTMPRTTPKSP
jgi:signal transduction histidine kinase